MRIDYLADHPEAAPLLAAWHHDEWKDLLPGWTHEQALAELRSHTGRRQIPTTFVAVDQSRVVGSASLLTADLDGWEHLSPWVASVYVVPERRGLGIGRRLIARAVEEAAALDVPQVYLFTAGQETYYARLGWSPLTRTRHHTHEVVIMRRPTPCCGTVRRPCHVRRPQVSPCYWRPSVRPGGTVGRPCHNPGARPEP